MRVPMRRMMPRMIRPIEYAKASRLRNNNARLSSPMANRLKPNTKVAITAIKPNNTTALTAPEIICATTYSRMVSGVMNMLVRLRDQTFHNAPSDIEYCAMRMISHSNVPMYRYCATVGFITLDKKRVTNPNTTTVINDQNGRSNITSTERTLMYTSWSSTARMRSADIFSITTGYLQEHVFERGLLDFDVDNAHARV